MTEKEEKLHMADEEEKPQLSDQDKHYIRSGKMGSCLSVAIGFGFLVGFLIAPMFSELTGLIITYLSFFLGGYIGYRLTYKG